MRQVDATNVSESIPVITSPAVPLQLELNAENGQHLSRCSANTNSFADLARAAHRVLSSGLGRRTRLMSPNRFL
eukprot:2813918-Pyramimonas_sp.AAC.1